MPTIKKLSIKDNETGLYDTRDVGIEAQNGIVSYDNSGNIIEDIGSATVSTTSSIATALKDIHDDFAPKAHATSSSDIATSYGKASTSDWGHVKITNGTGITVSNGEIGLNLATSADTAAGKIVQANDARLSDTRTPKSHVASDATYGAATTAQYGHVKVGTGLSVSNGVISVNYSTSATAGAAVQANDARLSNSRTPSSHASTATTYGIGTSANYGHVKLVDYSSVTSSQSASSGVGASGKALYEIKTAFTDTGVKHTKNTAVGSATKPIYITSTGSAAQISYTIGTSVPASAKFTDTTYAAATTAANGLMSKADKTKLDSLSATWKEATLSSQAALTTAGKSITLSGMTNPHELLVQLMMAGADEMRIPIHIMKSGVKCGFLVGRSVAQASGGQSASGYITWNGANSLTGVLHDQVNTYTPSFGEVYWR